MNSKKDIKKEKGTGTTHMPSTPLTERQIIEALWKLLDNIDTLSDICKPTVKDPKAAIAFYNNAMRYAEERFKYMQSDGYKIFTNEEFAKLAKNDELHDDTAISSLPIHKYRKIPIIITKWNDEVKGWRAEIADNYENYKPARYDDINFEDLTFHFHHDIPTHFNDCLVFYTRKDAVKAAKFCNKTYLGGKAKIWFIS